MSLGAQFRAGYIEQNKKWYEEQVTHVNSFLIKHSEEIEERLRILMQKPNRAYAQHTYNCDCAEGLIPEEKLVSLDGYKRLHDVCKRLDIYCSVNTDECYGDDCPGVRVSVAFDRPYKEQTATGVAPFPTPLEEEILYKDQWLYVKLAAYPATKGHVVVVWQKEVPDIHLLSDREHDYLMQIMDVARDALLKVLGVEKVYLAYLDEAKRVHWHLVPRYDVKGFAVFAHQATEKNTDFSLVGPLRDAFADRLKIREINRPDSQV